jgi:hypothetical protein
MNTEIRDGADWHDDFRAWLEPFLAAFRRSEQRYWAPLYLQGLLGPGHRKSVEPMAERVCPGQTQQLHHFVSASTAGHRAAGAGAAPGGRRAGGRRRCSAHRR